MRYVKPSLTVLFILAAGSTAQSIVELLSNTPEISNFTSLVSKYPDFTARLSGASNITILAPNDKAISSTMKMISTETGNHTEHIESLLAYHVLKGTYRAVDFGDKPEFLPTLLTSKMWANITAGESQVVKGVLMGDHAALYSGLSKASMVSKADINFTSGVVHIIDNVLTLPMNVSTTAISSNLTAIAGALTKADLADTIDTLSGVTIFAPSNAAFQAIGNLAGGLSREQLASILKYHVVPVRAFTVDLQNSQKLRTAQSGEITIRINNGDVYANGAKVIVADVITNNGVIHVIDGVLNPNDTDDQPDTSASTQAPAFPSATGSSDVPFTSLVPTLTGSGMATSSPTTSSENPSEAGSITGNAVIAVMGAALVVVAGMMV
ncbi:FAS1 domain-containing protein [Tuber indicum]|nr:FAS1 domain-containing protein [Tuber indicum]